MKRKPSAAAKMLNVENESITEQGSVSKRTLVKSENEFKLFVESVKDYALFMLDREGNIISWNKGAERIKGYTTNEILGKHFSIFYTEEDLNSNKPAHELQIARKTGKYEEEGWRVRKDKTLFWAHVTINAIVNDNGELHGFAKITRDITERKNMIDELHAIQAREDFLSIASHELKTPVTILLLQLQGLQRYLQKNNDPVAEQAFIAKNIVTCEQQAKRLSKLLDQLLDLTRIRLGQINLELQEIDLGLLMQDIILRTQNILPQGIDIKLAIKQPVIGKWDINRVEQILTNLISNAIKYGDNKPIEIMLNKDTHRQQAILSVKDYGLGIPVEMQHKIFERFERAERSRNLGGLGLGLYIVRQIVEAHGGSIQVQSEEGQGSIFTVLLPLHTN
jgi:PAS domain S-box-containing protein